MLFNLASEYAMRKVLTKHEGTELNGTHQLLVYADDVNKVNINIIKENIESLLEVGPEV